MTPQQTVVEVEEVAFWDLTRVVVRVRVLRPEVAEWSLDAVVHREPDRTRPSGSP